MQRVHTQPHSTFIQLTSVATLLTITGLTSSVLYAAEGEVVTLDEVTVSAGKINLAEEEYLGNSNTSSTGLDLTVTETPQTVNIITTKQIEDQKLTDINQVLSQTTGVTGKEYDSTRKYYYSRGFEIDNYSIDGTQVMYDSVWGTGEGTMSTIIYDQVEVTKGSNGLSSGTGNPGASVNLRRKRADSKEFEGTASVSAGSYNQVEGSLDVQGGLNASKSVRGRLVLEQSKEDSFRDAADTEQQTLFATVEADISDKTLFTVGVSRSNVEDDGATWGGLPLFYDDGTRTDWDTSKTSAADWTYWNVKHNTAFAELAHSFNDNWKVTAKFDKGESDGDSALLYLYGNVNEDTGLGLTAYPGGKYDVDGDYETANVSLDGKYNLFGRTHETNIGVSHSKRNFDADAFLVTNADTFGDFNAYDGTGYAAFEYGDRYDFEDFTEEQNSAYASTRLNVSDKLKVIAGARVTNYTKEFGSLSGVESSQVLDYDNEVIPYFGVLRDLNNNVTAFASYTDIFKPQNEVDKDGNNLDPIFGKSYEIGLKSNFLEDRVTGQLSLFKIDQDNLATLDGTETVLDTTSQAYVEEDGTTSKGFELELAGSIREGWNFQVGFSQYDLTDASGEELDTNQARKSLKLFTSYKLPGQYHKWTVGGGLNWESESYGSAYNSVTGETERVEQEAYTLINLMAKYDINHRSSLQLNVENATDETYFTNIGTFGQYSYGNPRAATLNYTYKF